MWTYGGSAERLADNAGIHSSEALDAQASTSLQHYNGNENIQNQKQNAKTKGNGRESVQSVVTFGFCGNGWQWDAKEIAEEEEEEEKDKKAMRTRRGGEEGL